MSRTDIKKQMIVAKKRLKNTNKLYVIGKNTQKARKYSNNCHNSNNLQTLKKKHNFVRVYKAKLKIVQSPFVKFTIPGPEEASIVQTLKS